MSWVWPHCILLQYLLFGIGRDGQLHRVVLSSHIIFKMGHCVCFQVCYSTIIKSEFSISACIDIRSDLFSYHGPALCNRQFFCWWVPLHNDERKHNLISTFIYRTDCSNGVITISSAPCCLPSPLSHPHPAFLAPCLFRPHSFLEECIWNPANENKWTNECFMNAFMMRKCKWGWVNEWMFNERLFNEKDFLTRALT